MENNPFKANSGKWLTQSLVYEYSYTVSDHTIFTLQDEDIVVEGKKLKSLKKLYMQEMDPTGYDFAVKHLGGWQHWKTMKASPFFKPHIHSWEEELEIKMVSAGLKEIVDDATSQSKTSVSSAKFLVSKGWIPSKEKTKAESRRRSKQQESVIKSDFEEDFKRIQIN